MWNDKHGIGEDFGSNFDYTSVLGDPTKKVKKPRWQGVPQRMSTSTHIDIESMTKPIPDALALDVIVLVGAVALAAILV